MGYSSKIDETRQRGYNHAIATKILDMMEKLRLTKNDNSSRRWIWELIQNAKDVAFGDLQLSIEVNLGEDKEGQFVEFSHNGKPFLIENITFLIQQESTKSRKVEEGINKTTGKFGTGFLTTHLLSEVVEVHSVVKEEGEPYRQFNLLLDRSGRDIDSIIDSVNKSMATLNEIDSQPEYSVYSQDELNTTFRYRLDDSAIEVAKKGIDDLDTSFPYSLVFLSEVKSLKIINTGITYIKSNDVVRINDNIEIYRIFKNDVPIDIAVLKNGKTSIAVEVEIKEERYFFKKINGNIPKLFCDFPLIGMEGFPFPVIINNPLFNPTEPRDGIYLSDIDDPKIMQNKQIIKDAIELYFILLEYASKNNWGNIYLLADIKSSIENNLISSKWLKEEVIQPIREKLIITPLVDTEGFGRIPIILENQNNVWFPSSASKELRKKIWELASVWIPRMLPREEEVDVWYDILWDKCPKLTVSTISNSIDKMQSVDNIQSKLQRSFDPIQWLNKYYAILNEDEHCLNDVINDKYSVIPNQNGILKNKSELRVDRGIDNELKNVLAIMGQDPREYLVYKGVHTGEIRYYVKEQSDIIKEINEKIRAGEGENLIEGCEYLLSLFADAADFPTIREKIFMLSQKLYPNKFVDRRNIVNWSNEIWQEVDKIQLKRMVVFISEKKSISGVMEALGLDDYLDVCKWIYDFIHFLIDNDHDNLIELKTAPILPNQKGDFLSKDKLFLDNGDIDEELKDICALLGHDFREELLDINICLKLPDNRIITRENVAKEIYSQIIPKFAEVQREEETKNIFKKLHHWFNQNSDLAKKLFPELYKNRCKLYDDEEVTENMEKAHKYDEIMMKHGIEDYNELEELLDKIKEDVESSINDDRQELTEEVLIQLGITDEEQLNKALEDEVFRSNFIHYSEGNVIKFEFVENIINRSIENVFQHLQGLSEYDVSNPTEIAKTIYLVTKNGKDLYVIIRPADYDQVIIYYDSERDILDYEKDCELWTDNKGNVEKITFGRILKITGINKIPLRRIK